MLLLAENSANFYALIGVNFIPYSVLGLNVVQDL